MAKQTHSRLAWLVVLALNPTDPVHLRLSKLSFLSVFILVQGRARWLAPRPLTPVEQLLEESRTATGKMLRALMRMLHWLAFAVSFILGVTVRPADPLSWQNLAVVAIGFILGPPLVLLTSIALVAGFLLLLVSPVSIWLGTGRS